MTARRGPALLLTLAALAASSGCRQILGADEFGLHPSKVADAGAKDSGSNFTGSCDGVEYDSEICAACVSTPGACCNAAAACAAEPACAAMAACLAQCTVSDSACRGGCNLRFPQTRELLALISCEATNCANCGAGRIVWGNAACDACLQREPDDACSSAIAAISKDPSELHDEVTAPCVALDCPSVLPHCACDAYGPDAPKMSALLACTKTGRCASACNPESDFSCLGSVPDQERATSLDALDLHLKLVDPLKTDQVLANFLVLACNELDRSCAIAREGDGATFADVHGIGQSAKSDPTTGTAALEITRSDAAGLSRQFFGHLYVMPTDTTAEETAPALMYFFPPLRASPAWVTRRIVSKALADLVASTPGIGVSLDWSKNGGLAFRSESCDGNAPGMQVQLSSHDHVYYIGQNGAADPSLQATSSEGAGFAWNIAPNYRETLTVTVGPKLVGTYTVQILANTITHLIIHPQ